jgi:hypothetical protein
MKTWTHFANYKSGRFLICPGHLEYRNCLGLCNNLAPYVPSLKSLHITTMVRAMFLSFLAIVLYSLPLCFSLPFSFRLAVKSMLGIVWSIFHLRFHRSRSFQEDPKKAPIAHIAVINKFISINHIISSKHPPQKLIPHPPSTPALPGSSSTFPPR